MVQPYSPPDPLPDLPPPTPPQQNRAALVLAVVAAALVVIVAVSIPLGLRVWHDLTDADAAESAASLDEVHAFGGLSTQHTEDDVDYGVEPPAGGPHDPQWLDCGVYDVPVRDENTVHSLEHGTVWITHRDVSDEDLARLEELLPDEGILSPYPSQEAAVVVTVWARQLELESADDRRLELFLEEYGDGHTAPEPMASCVGGVDETVSGGVDI